MALFVLGEICFALRVRPRSRVGPTKGYTRMSACPQCGTVAKPNDKFCNTCGLPLNTGAPMGGFGPPPQGGGGFAPPAQGFGPPPGFGGGPPGGPPGAGPARCQMGHEIAPGASYCPQGHPLALDAMQFASDAYGGGGGGYGGP